MSISFTLNPDIANPVNDMVTTTSMYDRTDWDGSQFPKQINKIAGITRAKIQYNMIKYTLLKKQKELINKIPQREKITSNFILHLETVTQSTRIFGSRGMYIIPRSKDSNIPCSNIHGMTKK